MPRYQYDDKPTPVDIAAALGLNPTDVTVTTLPDGTMLVDVPRDLTAQEQTALDGLMRSRRGRGKVT